MKKQIICSFFLFLTIHSYAQITLRGTVLNALDSQPIEGAILYFPDSGLHTVSDSAGNFNILLPALETPKVSHIAYEDADRIYMTPDENVMTVYLFPRNNLFETITITASRAGQNSPVTYTNISSEELNKNNYGADMPVLLEFTPAAVVTSDAGNGIGYSGIRIRGSDATRVNVTINGIPYNDAESQQTYWVDLPDFASSVNDMQIQRGVGSSSNGITSLGAAVNINTNELSTEPFGSASFSTGSFSLLKATALFGTGLVNEHWIAEGRISKIKSDGYIDRAYSDLGSFFIKGKYISLSEKPVRYTATVDIFSGEEHTYQSWAGVPLDSLETNRTFNPYTYANQTDNYEQTHYQLHQQIYTNTSDFHLALNYTKGSGYYEQLEEDQSFADYGIGNVVINSDTIFIADLITQKWLDNDFYGGYLNYHSSQILHSAEINIGTAFFRYSGDHYGKVIWSEFASTIPPDFEWYRNNAGKDDGNIYISFIFPITNLLHCYIDLQGRIVNYRFYGLDYDQDDQLIDLDQQVQLQFFNPKIGFTYDPGLHQQLSIFLGKSSKEPNRDDYVESTSLSRPSPETLYDAEFGYKLKWKGWQMQSVIYYMYYRDQLVLNGEINDVGAYTRVNVPESFRTGIELAWAKTFYSHINWNANIALSDNKIKSYTEYVDNWDSGLQVQQNYENTTIAFSPAVVASNEFDCVIYQWRQAESNSASSLNITLRSKYVGRQFIDNTESENRSLDPYFVNHIAVSFSTGTKSMKELRIQCIVQNVFDQQYESNAWIYRYIYEQAENELNGYFPQAGRNLIINCSLSF